MKVLRSSDLETSVIRPGGNGCMKTVLNIGQSLQNVYPDSDEKDEEVITFSDDLLIHCVRNGVRSSRVVSRRSVDVYVKTVDGRIIPMTVNLDDSVSSIKEFVMRTTGISALDQRYM